MKFRVYSILLSLLVLLVFAAGSLPCFGANSEDALSAILDAEAKVATCYRAVADAEKAGANVSDLLNLLNEAGWLLSKAHLAYNCGDYDSAFTNASECLSKLEGFVNQAYSLRLEAEQAKHLDFMFNFVGSAIGSVAVALGGYGVWFFLKKREKY